MDGKKHKRKIYKFPEPADLPKIEGFKKWKDEYVRQVFFFTLLGANDVQLAQVFDIAPSVLDYWKRTKPEFMESIRRGKTEADAKVAHSIYLSAIGYSHPDQVVLSNKKKRYDPNTGKLIEEWTEPLIVDTIKSYPPNVTAAIKWLQARQPDVWGKKLEVRGQIEHRHQIDLSQYTDEELKLMRKLGLQNQIVDAQVVE